MIHYEYDCTDAPFWFGLEQDLMEQESDEDVFLLWHTHPTLMLGRYQSAAAELDLNYAAERGIPVVRRLTGGGTIYTDPGSWQFSFIERETNGRIDFARFAEPVRIALRKMGLDISMSARNDLLIGGRKFCGNAQCHSGGRVLHHGSILFDADLDEMVRCLRVDREKLTTKGIRSISQRVVNLREFLPSDMDSAAFRDRLLDGILPAGAKRIRLSGVDAEQILKTRAPFFASWDWVHGHSPDFQVVHSKRLPGGKVEIRLNLENGRIAECGIFGDFFLSSDPGVIASSLVGCRYDRASLHAALAKALSGASIHQIEFEDLASCFPALCAADDSPDCEKRFQSTHETV